MGNTATWSVGTGYLFATGDAFRTADHHELVGRERITKGSELARGVWKTLTYTQTGTTGTLYEDGVQVAQNTAVTVKPSDIGAAYDHQQQHRQVQLLAGQVPQGQAAQLPHLRPCALPAAEVTSLAPTDADIVASDKAALDLVGDLSAVKDNLNLPTTGQRGPPSPGRPATPRSSPTTAP